VQEALAKNIFLSEFFFSIALTIKDSVTRIEFKGSSALHTNA
jgi:hypothetical protein